MALQQVENDEEINMVVDQDYLPNFLPALQQHNINEGPINVNLNINMALTSMSSNTRADPGWTDRMTQKQSCNQTCPDVYRLWARYFSPVGKPDQVIQIPTDWEAFFVMMLMSLAHFEWAKNFLNSHAWRFMLSCSTTFSSLSFALPASCLVSQEVQCLSYTDSSTMGRSSSTPGSSQDKPKSTTPHIETEARRSPRIRSCNEGFKHSSCANRNRLACAATPLPYPPKP